MTATDRTPRLPWAGPAVERRRDSDNAAEVVPRGLRVTAAIGWRLLVVAAALWVLGQVIAYLSGIVIPVAIALLLAALLAPAVQRLVQWRVPRGLATAMVLVGGLAALGVLLTFVVRTVVGGVPQLGSSLGQSINELSGWLANGPLHVSAEQLQAVQGQLQTFVQQNVGGITAATLTTAATIGEVLTEFLLVVFTLIFFLHGGEDIWRFFVRGVPARVRSRVDEEMSIGDYVLSGGELAALVIIDVVARFIPGVVGDEQSVAADSFSRGLLDFPQYTRPAEIGGLAADERLRVPEVLLSGNHAEIRRWRKRQSLTRTLARRPELLNEASLDEEEQEILRELVAKAQK